MSNYVNAPRGAVQGLSFVWDVGLLEWVPETQPGGGSGGGGGAVTVSNGSDVTQGNTGDAAWVSGAGTVISLLKKIASGGGGGGGPVSITAPLGVQHSATSVSVTLADDISNPIPVNIFNAPISVNQGTATAIASGGWLTKITDGSFGPVAVKDASTDAVAADPALVTRSVQLPLALAANGGLKVEGVAGGIPLDVSAGVVTVTGLVSAGITATPVGQQNMANSMPVVFANNQTIPIGASTSALQTTGNTSLSSIDTKTLAAGQAAMAASSPVVIASNQSAVPVSGTFWQATQPVSLASAPTTAVTVADGVDVAQGTTSDVAWVSGAGTTISLLKKIASSGASAGLTDTQLRASAVPVSLATAPSTPVTGTFWQATQPVSIATAPALVASSAVIGHVIVDTTSTTAVTQATGSNLHAVLDAGSAVIGHVIADTGSTTAVTGNVAVTSAGLTNLDVALSTRTKPADQQHAIIDSGTTTVTQATGTNLHAVIDSGTVTANAGTNLNTSALALDATLTGGTQKTKLVDTGGVNVAGINSNGSLLVQGYQPAVTSFTGVNATGALASQSASGFNVATVTLRTFTGTGPSITWKLQVSDDNTNWADVQGINNSSGAISITWTQPAALTAGTAGISTDYTIGAYTNVRINVTAISGTTPVAAFGLAFQTMPYEASPGVMLNGWDGTIPQLVSITSKGTQGAKGVATQELRDSGRNTRIFMLDAYTAGPLVEAVATVVQWYNNAAVAGTTQPAVVPAGKTLRLTGYKIMYQSIATAGYGVVRIRANTAGLGVLGSPLVASFESGTPAAVAGVMTTQTGSFPEGLELPAATGIAFSIAGYGAAGALTLAGGIRFEVHGYEY